jgi:hypothetical protein
MFHEKILICTRCFRPHLLLLLLLFGQLDLAVAIYVRRSICPILPRGLFGSGLTVRSR